nr:unnamed protein product [Spirometra erinaceieuropaei]
MHLTPAGCPWKEHFFELEKELSVEEDATLEKSHLPFSKRAVFLVTDRTNDFSVTAIPVSTDQPFSQRYTIDWVLGLALHEGDGVEFAPGH